MDKTQIAPHRGPAAAAATRELHPRCASAARGATPAPPFRGVGSRRSQPANEHMGEPPLVSPELLGPSWAKLRHRLALRIAEAADLLGVSSDTVGRMIRSGELPVIRLRGSVRIPRAALEIWVDEQWRVEG
jgi:excisionase family DNA binding protein